MLSTADLEWMRDVQEEAMPFTCTIRAPGAATRDAYGEEVAGTITETEVACGLQAAKGTEVLAGGGIASVGEPILRLPARTVVPQTATIVKAAGDGDVERTYQVKSPLAGASYETALRVLVTEI
jgi:hypothetical protein